MPSLGSQMQDINDVLCLFHYGQIDILSVPTCEPMKTVLSVNLRRSM